MSISKTVTAFKAFKKDWTCRGFQYEVGKTYTHDGDVEICESGFHVCLHPLDVLRYYPAAGSKFAVVNIEGATDERGEDTKVAGSKITITAELQISELIESAVTHVFDAAKWIKSKSATGPRGAASATGDSGAASATGTSGAASATGYRGRVMGATGNALFACEREIWDGPIISVACGIVGQDGVEPGKWYSAKGGKLVEVDE